MKYLLNYPPQLLIKQKAVRRVLTIGLCSCISVGMYANILADEVSLTCKNKTLKQALEINRRTGRCKYCLFKQCIK